MNKPDQEEGEEPIKYIELVSLDNDDEDLYVEILTISNTNQYFCTKCNIWTDNVQFLVHRAKQDNCTSTVIGFEKDTFEYTSAAGKSVYSMFRCIDCCSKKYHLIKNFLF